MGVVKLSEYRHGTNRFVCQNPVSESEVCGYAWELAVPDAGKVDYQIACLRCWHAYEITVKAPKPPRPAETQATPAEADLPSRPRPGLRRPLWTAAVLRVR